MCALFKKWVLMVSVSKQVAKWRCRLHAPHHHCKIRSWRTLVYMSCDQVNPFGTASKGSKWFRDFYVVIALFVIEEFHHVLFMFDDLFPAVNGMDRLGDNTIFCMCLSKLITRVFYTITQKNTCLSIASSSTWLGWSDCDSLLGFDTDSSCNTNNWWTMV